MTSSRDRRVAKELADIQNDRDNSGVFAASTDGVSLRHLTGTIPAPPDTPYAGATFQIEIEIPDTYPFKSPAMRFQTKIWHPNGAICLDTLGSGWSPVQTIKTALLSLRMLLEFPNPKDPQDAEVAKMLVNDPELFALTAHEWAVKYGGAPRGDVDLSKYRKDGAPPGMMVDEVARYKGYNKNLVDRFVNMGFDVDAVVEAFLFFRIERHGGEDFELSDGHMGDITSRLLGEQQ